MSNFTIIAAFDENYNIGKNNSIPWHFPEDLLNFKKRTIRNVCIMGRNTWESLPKKSKPLPFRHNIILSKNKNLVFEKNQYDFGLFVVGNIQEALVICNSFYSRLEWFVIGGKQVYKNFIEKNIANKMIITHIHGNYDGDVKFPTIDWTQWKSVELESNENFTIKQYDKIN